MSNVLKKITKKYKWLRFLNYKTTKLAVLSAALFGLCLSSGASFAKYRDENYGGGSAGIALFTGGRVSYRFQSIQTPPKMAAATHEGFYVFKASFWVEMYDSEVESVYSLKLRVTHDDETEYKEDNTNILASYTAFTLEGINGSLSSGLLTFGEVDGTTQKIDANISNFVPANENVKSFENNMICYGSTSSNNIPSFDTNNNQWLNIPADSSYSWQKRNLSATENAKDIELVTKKEIEYKVDFYQILFYVYMNDDNPTSTFIVEDSRILFWLNVEQKGGTN